MNQRPQALPVHPGCSWEVFLTFLARPGPASLMRSQPRAWAVSPPIPPRGSRACLLHIHVCVGSCLLLPIKQLGDPPLLSMSPPPGPSCTCKAHVPTACSTCSPCGPRVWPRGRLDAGLCGPDSNQGRVSNRETDQGPICPAGPHSPFS